MVRPENLKPYRTVKTLAHLTVWIALAATASASAPSQPTLTRYSKLWTKSVFTTPAPEEVSVRENPLQDYALGGISKLEDGYYAILLNRKKPEEKVVIYPGQKSNFQVVDVKWPDGSWKDAVVTVRNGSNTGTVKFEDKLLAVKTAAVKPTPAKAKPAANNNNNNNQGNRRREGQTRTPRPRVVVPNR